MLLNLIIIIFIIIFGFLQKVNKSTFLINADRNKLTYIYVVSIILILQSALRNIMVGDDTFMYYHYFEEVKALTWDEAFNNVYLYLALGLGKDPGFPIFMKLFQIVSGSFRLFLFLIAILFFTALGRLLYKNTKNLDEIIIGYVVYSVMFYSFYSITGLRQTVVMSICLLSFEFVKKRKFIKFILSIALIYTIHKTAVFFVPVYFLYRIKRTKLIYVVVLILFPIIFLFKDAIALTLVNFSGTAYESYAEYEGEKGTYTFTFFILFLSVIIVYIMKRMFLANPLGKPIVNIFVLSVIITPLTYVNPSLMRLVMYYSIFLVLLLPIMIQSFSLLSTKLKSLANLLVILLLILLFIKSNGQHEYKFFWQEMIVKQ